MAPNPPAGGSPPAGKGLSLKSPWAWVIIGGIALAGGAYILYRNRKAASSSTGAGSSSGASPDYSGALGTLQDEIGNLQSSGAGASGTVGVPVTGSTGTDTSGGAGSVTPAAGPASGGNSPGASGGTSSTSTGSSDGTSTSSGGGGGTATATQAPPVAPSVTNGRILSLSANRATIAWDGPGATQWDVVRVGPGSPNGITNRVYAPVAVYTGLQSGHNYEIRIYPVVNGQRVGTPGGIDFKTK